MYGRWFRRSNDTLPTMYASILGLDFDQLSSSLMAVLMVANILAIVFAAIMDKIGKGTSGMER